jgi:phospholipid/cholesterol/gamma-HCH transport system substrate-binding protein
MEREANYIAVGSFVLLVIVMGVLFVYWYADSRDHRHFMRYEIYFDGSVSGLSDGGPVRYLGVDVGRVQRIRIDPRAADRVQVIADIDDSTPISERTVAQLSLQGITGLLYIDLQRERDDDTARRILAAVPSEQYPVIRSAHSDFDLFLSSLPDLTARLNGLVDRASRIVSDRNIAAITHVVASLDATAARLPASTRKLDALLDDLRASVSNANRVINDVHNTTQAVSGDVVAAVQKLRATSDNLERATGRLDVFVAENGEQLSGFVREGLPQVEALLRDSRAAAQQITELSRSLADNPSRLLYRPVPSGIEIPP